MKGRIIFAVLLLIFGPGAVRTMLGGTRSGLFVFVEYLPLLIVGVATAGAIIVERVSAVSRSWVIKWGTSVIGSAILALYITVSLYRFYIDSSKTRMVVSSLAEARFVSKFDFKRNGRFRLTRFDMLGQSIYYGSYSVKGDTLTILSSNFSDDSFTLPDTGHISGDTIQWYNFEHMTIEQR